ncbi:microfibrillar-associated 1 family protein, partial [Kitasatospora sp. DSM 101779]|uniref:microfibrillar-associated 1 family protein n=2 Tax=Kitasatospora sp. DSM 101779 TaxID=2853165 RepID=UPI0021DB680A
MSITADRPVRTSPVPTARHPAPGSSHPAAPAGAVHVVSRQEYDAAKTALAKLKKLGDMITRSLMSIGGGALIFTCANVTLFAMTHHIPVWIAWMLDPMASLALITVLYVDGVLAEQGGERAGTWPFLLRWFAGISTWLMNSWTSLYPDGHFTLIPAHPDAGGLLLHSVAPFLLITMAEASSGYRKYLAKRLGELRQVVQAFEDQQHAAKSESERRTREENERAERERREAERAEREDRRRREDREYEERLERERMREAAEVARIASQTETERLREQRELENARAKREAEKEQREREAEIERLREETALENARALREAERLRA